jgi:plasmid maintenance system killer protein
VEVAFATRKLAKLCNSQKNMRGELGPRCAARLGQRLAELEAATTLEDMRLLPSARCHELTGDRRGQLAVDLVHPLRLIFEADPQPERADGGLDWVAVTRVVIVAVVDYH